MKIQYITVVFMALAAFGLQAGPRVLAPMAGAHHAAPASDNSEQSVVLVDEDFSRMSSGSESEPDGTYIADKRTGVIPATYTATPGWSGAAIYQAGGACAILKGRFSDGVGGVIEDTGFLRTPQGTYSGNLTLTFRAKLLKNTRSSDKMDIALLNDSGRLESTVVDLTPEWETFTVNFTKGEFSGCLIQFSMASEEVLIDDVKICTVLTSIPAPRATGVTNYTEGGFTANWQPVAEADSYLVTVYEKKVSEAVVCEDFDNLNIIPGTNRLDKSDPGFTDGWTVSYGTVRNSDHVSSNGYEGSTGMIFRATGEGFATPVFDRPIRDFSFYAAHPSGQSCMSTLVVSVLVDGQWGTLGNYDVERISREGEIIRLSSNFPEGGVNAVQVKFRKNEQNDAGRDVSIVVDHIRIMTDPEPVPVLVDLPTADCSLAISGLDPYKDYSYTVRAVNQQFVSSESNEITASGLPCPKLSEAQNVGDNSFTAVWCLTPKADGYIVSNYNVYTVQEASENTIILHEDFSKVLEGSLDAPVGLYNVVNPLALDDYTHNPGWLGLATYLVKGMLGTRSYMGITGMIQTPVLDLSGNNGAFRVTVTVTGDTDATNEELVVQAGMEEYISLPIEAGKSVTLNYDFNCGQEYMPLAFYSYNGFPFYIDEITVTQSLPKGAQIYREIEERVIDNAETLTADFTALAPAANEHYAYRVFAYRDFMGSREFSGSDSVRHVYLDNTGIDEIESVAPEGPCSWYRIDGVKLSGMPEAPGIYICRTPSGPHKVIIR